MGVIKSKKKAAKPSKIKQVASKAVSALSGVMGKKTSTGVRRGRRMTVSKLVNKIAILKLKKKYNKLRYAGV